MNKSKHITEVHSIGLIFFPDEWMGGVYYILNLINALKYLPDPEQPELLLFVIKKGDFDRVVRETGYPRLKPVYVPAVQKESIWTRFSQKLYRVLHGKESAAKICPFQPAVLYPYAYHPWLRQIKNRISWVPDLQDKYYPEFFSPEECAMRDRNRKLMLKQARRIVFSSEAAKKDFEKFYQPSDWDPFVMHFASVPDIRKPVSADLIQRKFSIPEKYFYAPNQFWKHKNHGVVIEAVNRLIKQGAEVCVVFSGKENDPRNPDYSRELKEKVQEYGIEKYVRFLGFIDREDVFSLMQHSVAVIQPSLFEGWSTVVEDAMSVGAGLLLSDLAVNHEQAGEKALYFNPLDPTMLAEGMQSALQYGMPEYNCNYTDRIRDFARCFLKMAQTETRLQA